MPLAANTDALISEHSDTRINTVSLLDRYQPRSIILTLLPSGDGIIERVRPALAMLLLPLKCISRKLVATLSAVATGCLTAIK